MLHEAVTVDEQESHIRHGGSFVYEKYTLAPCPHPHCSASASLRLEIEQQKYASANPISANLNASAKNETWNPAQQQCRYRAIRSDVWPADIVNVSFKVLL